MKCSARSVCLFLSFFFTSLAPAASTPAPDFLNSTTYADCVVTFNEIMYQPTGQESDLEWIELCNQLAVDQDLSGWSLTGGIQFRFPPGTILGAGKYLVVASNPAALEAASGFRGALGPFTGRLGNEQDRVLLRNLNNRLMDEISYRHAPPWPIAADGSGASLAKRFPRSPSSPAQNWRASREAGGTPGGTNFPELSANPEPVIDTLVARGTQGRWLVPNQQNAGDTWIDPAFADTAWNPGTNGFGFDTSAATQVSAADRYYRFEGTAADASGNRVHAFLQNGARYVPEPSPAAASYTAIRFDGLDDQVKVDDPISPYAYTISVWVKPDEIRRCSLVVLTDASGPLFSWSHQLRLTENGQFEHYLFDGNGPRVTSTTVAVPGRWYHLLATAEASDVMRLFVNGQEEGTPVPVAVPWSAGSRWLFGSNSGEGFTFFNGVMDDVALWHRVLPPAQIAALAAGAAPAGSGGLTGLFLTDLTAEMAGVNSTCWARLPFNISAGAYYDLLTLKVRYDDGFIAWLNGTEIARRNFSGTPAWNSRSSVERPPNEVDLTDYIDITTFTSLLRTGQNVLALQGLNASATNGDFAIEVELTARHGIQPTFDAPIRFSELPGAAASPFWVELVNIGTTSLPLRDFILRSSRGFTTDLPDLLLAPGELALVQSWPEAASFALSDRLFLLSRDSRGIQDAIRIESYSQARLGSGGSTALMVPSALTPGASNQFQLRDEIVINEIMYHPPPTFAKPGIPPSTRSTTVINWDSTWRYEQSGTDLGTAWREPGYNDSSWGRGPGVLGARTGALPQPIRTPLQLGKWTYYFRIPFVLTEPPGSCDIQFRTLVDDGAVFYLNGREFYRHRMPDGEIRYNTPGINQGDPPIVGPVAIPATNFVVGVNWLAVEVHQWDLASSDMVCAAELSLCEIIDPGTPSTPFTESDQQWVELYNRSTTAIDLGSWRLDDAARFTFPTNTILAPDSYLVIARNAPNLRTNFPNARILGNFTGRLSGRSERLALLDANGNLVDEVRYHDEAPWPDTADGGGATLELTDPFADNSNPAAWAPSASHLRSPWRHYSYSTTAIQPTYSPALYNFHELRFGLLNDGELLLDNLSVIENPSGNPRELVQDPGFDQGATRFRLLGNHSRSRVIDDPDKPGNKLLHLAATDARGYMHNQVETTLKFNNVIQPVRTGTEYQISFDAKWLSGTPQFHTELYYNKIARKTLLELPSQIGTPGARNSTFKTNLGPTYLQLSHSPVVPRPGQTIQVTVRPADPDGLATLTLRYRVNDGSWQSVSMGAQSNGIFLGNISAQPTERAVVQFYIEGRDLRGATSFAPAGGPNSRALVRVDSRVPSPKRRGFHLILTPADSALLHQTRNMMSDDRLGATVIWDDQEIFYDCGVHLHGSMFSRNDQNSCAFNIRFPADRFFRGVHRTVQVKRRALAEIIAKHVQNQSGVPGMYEDIIELFSHIPGNAGPARISLAHYNDIFLGSQWENGTDGTLFNMEGIRVAMATDNNTPEGIKLPFPVDWVSNYDITDLGNDPEQYRFTTTIRNNRARDDYSAYIAMAKAFSLSGSALQNRVPEVMDVDEWMRMFALLSLFGIGDTYTQGNPHNINFYVRPSDSRVLAFPYDWDFFFAMDSSAPLWGDSNLSKIIALPVYTRVFHGHLLDLIETSFSTTYLQYWVNNFSSIADESYSYVLDRVRQRSSVVRTRLPAKIPFEITTNAGADFSVSTPSTTLEGRGWIDVRDFRIGGYTNTLPVTWLDANRWRLNVPLISSTNSIALQAFNRRGELVGEDSINITTTSPEDSQRSFLRITEIMYHPPAPTAAELAAGFSDKDDFEFIELANTGPAELSLSGVRFTAGVAFDFSTAALQSVPPGARLLLVRHPSAFAARYGTNLPVAGQYTGSLDNAGELIRLVDRNNRVIHEFTYDDRGSWPLASDGTGPSLVIINSSADYTDPANWRAGKLLGTPGQPEPVEPLIQDITLSGATLLLRFDSLPNQTYQLWTSDTLAPASWTLLRELPPSPTPGLREITEPLPAEAAERYFLLAVP